MAQSAIVIGSGPAGSITAWALAEAGWNVIVLERGRNLRPGFGQVPSGELGTLYGSDEVKGARAFGFPDPVMEPMTGRTQSEAGQGVERSAQGSVVNMGAAVGGTSLHYNAKFPRFWKQDFTQLSDLGPVDGANVADWPIRYEDLAPYYDEVEYRIGVQGDVAQMPDFVLAQAPRSRPFVMPPNPTGYAAQLLAQGARNVGFNPFPYPAAVNSTDFDGRPRCNSCGLCSGFGCPINARGDAMVSFLNPAVLTGRVRVIPRALAYRIETTSNGARATAVHYYDDRGVSHALSADRILIAGSPIQTARLLLLSDRNHRDGLGNEHGNVGRFFADATYQTYFPNQFGIGVRAQDGSLDSTPDALTAPWAANGVSLHPSPAAPPTTTPPGDDPATRRCRPSRARDHRHAALGDLDAHLDHATMLVMGGIVGAGIFANPSVVVRAVGSPGMILLAWVLGGLVALAGAFVYAELAVWRPHVGGQYVYLRDAFHPAPLYVMYGQTEATARLSYLQVVRYEDLAAQAETNRTAVVVESTKSTAKHLHHIHMPATFGKDVTTRTWETVKYCSDRCRMGRESPPR